MLHTSDDVGPQPGAAESAVPRWAKLTFIVLFAMNLLDYTDRWILSAVLPHLKAEFRLSYTQAGLLFTLFLVSYSLVSPVMGWLGDRWRRTWLLGIGVGRLEPGDGRHRAGQRLRPPGAGPQRSWGSARRPTACSRPRS